MRACRVERVISLPIKEPVMLSVLDLFAKVTRLSLSLSLVLLLLSSKVCDTRHL